MRLRFAAVTVALVALLGSPSAALADFSGPWDSAHQPPTVTNPNIEAGPLDTMGTFVVFPLDGFGCPALLITTFVDPTGSISDATVGQDNGFYCARTNSQTSTGSPDFSVTWGTIGSSAFLPTVSPRSIPFLYTVTDSAGAIVAQDTYTWTYGTFRINSGTSSFNTVCLDGHHTLYTDKTTGVIYCLTTEGVDTPGWPAPAPPPPPPPPPPTPPPTPSASAPPAPSITAHPSSTATKPMASFSFSDAQSGVHFKCSLDGGTFTDCTSPRRYQNLRIGRHTLRVRAADSLGQASADASYTWTVKAKYTMTLGNIRDWAWAAAVDQFYGGRGRTKLTAFRVSRCAKLPSTRLRCTVSWGKRPYLFNGTVTMGDANPFTGNFRFAFRLARRNPLTRTTQRITVAY